MKFNEAVKKILNEGPKDKLIKFIMKELNTDYEDADEKVADIYDVLTDNGFSTTDKSFDNLLKGLASDNEKLVDDKKYKKIMSDIWRAWRGK